MSKTRSASQSSEPAVVDSEFESDTEEMICGKCDLIISPKKNAPRCCACQKYFHGASCVIVSTESWGKWGPSRQRVWQCPPCKEISDSTEASVNGQSNKSSNKPPKKSSNQKASLSQSSKGNATGGGRSTVGSGIGVNDTAILANLGLDIDMAAFEDATQSPTIKNLNAMILYLVREVSGINAKFDKLNSEVTQLKATVKSLTEENKILKGKQTQSDEKHRIGDYQRRLLNDYSRVDNLVLHGGPKASTDEETFQLFQTVAEAYGVPLNQSEVSVCHPLPSKGPVNKQICRFNRRSSKIRLLLASKKKRLTGRILGWTNMDEDRLDEPVFITEHLSPDTARLLAETKKKLSTAFNGPYNYVWCKQGRILLRCEGDRGRPLEVRSYTDIFEIYNEAVQNGFVPPTQREATNNSPQNGSPARE